MVQDAMLKLQPLVNLTCDHPARNAKRTILCDYTDNGVMASYRAWRDSDYVSAVSGRLRANEMSVTKLIRAGSVRLKISRPGYADWTADIQIAAIFKHFLAVSAAYKQTGSRTGTFRPSSPLSRPLCSRPSSMSMGTSSPLDRRSSRREREEDCPLGLLRQRDTRVL
ncbi:hypothetical protein OH76DRAFT_696809 [Lentinus brumalis]|uniref:Uncharacterized protein n=1 Tax=Lentinus brumalis TaxID=2498619 RepID=A0A371D6C1_9APHY|nr:hypothetical protein OH76DRAFT_696809 [Polyporus brumalis]